MLAAKRTKDSWVGELQQDCGGYASLQKCEMSYELIVTRIEFSCNLLLQFVWHDTNDIDNLDSSGDLTPKYLFSPH